MDIRTCDENMCTPDSSNSFFRPILSTKYIEIRVEITLKDPAITAEYKDASDPYPIVLSKTGT